MKRETAITAFLWVITAASVVGMFSGSNEPLPSSLVGTSFGDVLYRLHYENSIIFNLSVGCLVSQFFWLLLVWLPERRRRITIKGNLQVFYRQFKSEAIHILLQASGGNHTQEISDSLLDHEEFKRYFSEHRNGRWYAAMNGLEHNQTLMNDLLAELDLLAQEVSYALYNLHVEDPRAHSFFKNLLMHVYRLKNSSMYTNEQVKHVCNFLWEVLARWSFVGGQRRDDIIQSMIDGL